MSLAEEQENLVRALVAGAPLPEGFDAGRVGAAARALLRKRTGEVLRAWPALDAEAFGAWAASRPPKGSWLDGWDFAPCRTPDWRRWRCTRRSGFTTGRRNPAGAEASGCAGVPVVSSWRSAGELVKSHSSKYVLCGCFLPGNCGLDQ